MDKRLKKAISVLVVCIGLILPTVVFAKKTANYVPPPFATRLLSSFITIVPIIVILSVAAYFLIRMFDKESAKNKKLIFICIVTVLIITSAIWAAMDALNDELSSPAFEGTNVGTLIFPIAVMLLNRRISFIKRLIIAILLVIPSLFLSLFIFEGWQELGMNIGLPTTW
jgi:hypothetical protein